MCPPKTMAPDLTLPIRVLLPTTINSQAEHYDMHDTPIKQMSCTMQTRLEAMHRQHPANTCKQLPDPCTLWMYRIKLNAALHKCNPVGVEVLMLLGSHHHH